MVFAILFSVSCLAFLSAYGVRVWKREIIPWQAQREKERARAETESRKQENAAFCHGPDLEPRAIPQRLCKCGHSVNAHNDSGCLACKCVKFDDPSFDLSQASTGMAVAGQMITYRTPIVRDHHGY